MLQACRPRQWVKNALVVFAPAAAGALTRPAVAAATAGAFVCFCLLASATYLLNDVHDRERDRRHPRKRHRPVASGRLSPRRATRIAIWLAILGVCAGTVIAPALGAVAIGYLALTTSYSILWRHVVLVDIAAVAAGFVVRAAAGGVAAGVTLSRSFLAVSGACALFVVAGKRYAELTAGGQSRDAARRTLARYSPRLIAAVLVGLGGGWLPCVRMVGVLPARSASFGSICRSCRSQSGSAGTGSCSAQERARPQRRSSCATQCCCYQVLLG